MLIAIDTLALDSKYAHTGTQVYLSNLLPRFVASAQESLGDTLTFYAFMGRSGGKAWLQSAPPHFRVVQTSLLRSSKAWRSAGLSIEAWRLHAQLIFSPNAFWVPWPIIPSVCTIHDAMADRLPAGAVEGSATAKIVTRIAARLSAHVITVSMAAKRDLVEVYGLAPEKITVVYNGYDRAVFNPASSARDIQEETKCRFGIYGPYALHHGMVQVRKNLVQLIQAFDRVTEHRADMDFMLVLAGPLGFRHEEILRAREASPNKARIVLTGPLEDAELATLIKGATFCVIPSLYEGFGLPVVEAMACGTPTIAANNSSIPEVSGGLLEYFDAHSIEDMASVMQRVMDDSALRERLREHGLQESRKFSWDKCAEETIEVLKQFA